MRRRDFLKTPAVSMLIPGLGGQGMLESLGGSDQQRDPEAAAERKFPQRIHQDFETYIPGMEYFPLGNGEIQAILQYCPDRSGSLPESFLGLAIMDAERFSRKQSTFLFHPERGLERTMVLANVNGTWRSATPETFTAVKWIHKENVPVISLAWTADVIDVHEELYVPSREPLLVRTISLTNNSAKAASVFLDLSLTANFLIFDEIGPEESENTVRAAGFTEMKLQCLEEGGKVSGRYDILTATHTLAPAESHTIRFVYRIRNTKGRIDEKHIQRLWKETVAYWSSKELLETGNATIDHLYAVSRNGLRAMISSTGKRDSGYWMYNMEWPRDDCMMVMGMLQAGFIDEARVLLTKILDRSVGVDGRTVESSRWVGYDYAELDQNGEILYTVWLFFCWTGDIAFVRKFWRKIRLTGEFPLQEVFRDPVTRMVRNKREFWERNDSFGVEDGYELAYQFWVAIGLEKGAELARRTGDVATAGRWEKAATEIRDAFLHNSPFRLIEDGRIIKRRTRDGRWQRFMIPQNRENQPPGSPLATEPRPECEPDTSSVYPIIFGMVDPAGDIAKNTLKAMDTLWNQKWGHGGYARYNTLSEPDPPGPWPFASLFVARAALEAGDTERVWQVINWLSTIHGGASGGWFERYGPSITPPAPPVSFVGWTWAEVVFLVVQHMMGFRPNLDRVQIRPRLIDGIDRMRGSFHVRGSVFHVSIEKTSGAPRATINGKETAVDGGLELPYPPGGSIVRVDINVTS